MFIINDRSPIPQIAFEIKRLQGLLKDLHQAGIGQLPDKQTIADAPIIENWQMAYRPEPCIVGTMQGHPTVTDGHTGMTSGVWLISPAFGYARTLSRIYALGRPAQGRINLS
jgi:hypothetical protein